MSVSLLKVDRLKCRAKKITLTIREEKWVIDLYYQGKTTREIAKIERMSICDISAIIKEEEAR
jgi:hypothetical protein